jgi:hypothetical protein
VTHLEVAVAVTTVEPRRVIHRAAVAAAKYWVTLRAAVVVE